MKTAKNISDIIMELKNKLDSLVPYVNQINKFERTIFDLSRDEIIKLIKIGCNFDDTVYIKLLTMEEFTKKLYITATTQKKSNVTEYDITIYDNLDIEIKHNNNIMSIKNQQKYINTIINILKSPDITTPIINNNFTHRQSFIPKEYFGGKCSCGSNLMSTYDDDFHNYYYCNCCHKKLFERLNDDQI